MLPSLRLIPLARDMQKMWLSILILLPNIAYAGMDFTGLSGDRAQAVPEFHTVQAAMDWVKETKWVEEYEKQLREKKDEILHEVGALQEIKYGSEKVKEIMNRWEIYAVALRMMEDYKEMGVKGTPVGASFYGGSIPWSK